MGSFNPVHKGHTGIAGYVVEAGLADQVWFVVSPRNPLKDTAELAPAKDRMEMVGLAVANNPSFVACDIEFSLPQPSYTINTVRKLRELYPEHNFTILAGSDIAETLDRWYKVDELKGLVDFMIYPRGDRPTALSPEMQDTPRYDISSTQIRRKLAEGICQPDELAPAVYGYVVSHHLYGVKTSAHYYTLLIETEPEAAGHYFMRGQIYFKLNDFSRSINDFERALSLDPACVEARELKNFVEEIFNFSYTEVYNP